MSRDPETRELQEFLERFRLASPTRVEEFADRVIASTPGGDLEGRVAGVTPIAADPSRGVDDFLVDWFDYPLNITFDPTGRCNVVCEMCDFHRVRSEKGWSLRQMPELAPEVLRARLRETVPIRTVTFSGGGAEFFVNKRWPELIAAARPRAREITVLTNGTTLTEKVRAQIVDDPIDNIRVSFHGATAETAMEIMKGSRFEDVKQNLSELVRLRDARGLAHPRLHISYLGMKKNIDEFPDFVDLAADLGADSVTLISMMERDAVGMEHTHGQSLIREPERLRRIWRAATMMASSRDIRLLCNDPYQNLLEGRDAVLDDEPHVPVGEGQTKLCMFPFDKPLVGLNGSVALCCSSTGRKVQMGNADVSSFSAVWHGENYTELRRSIVSGQNLPDFCAQCPRAPNVRPKTMELHAALTHARMTGKWQGLGIALRNAAHLGHYVAELRALHIAPIRIGEATRAVVRSGLRWLGLKR